jgi:uncharacterized cupin superfamily protein
MSDKKIIRLSANPEGFGSTPDKQESPTFVEWPKAQHTHSYYEDEDLGLYVGLWDTSDMIEGAGPYGCDEFMLLLEGQARLKNMKTGVMETAVAGEPFIIPKGYDCQWHQQGYLRKFYFISENPHEPLPAEPTHEGILIPSADDPVQPLSEAAPFTINGDSHGQKQHVSYRDATGKFTSGTWESGPFQSEPAPFPGYRLCCVETGSLVLTDEAGEQHVFNAGDTFFISQGTVCSAEASGKTRMFFASLAG